MNNEEKAKYILAFEKKHNVKSERYVSADVMKFKDGRYYELSDIVYDIENNIPVGQIENYSDIGTDSAISVSFQLWYKLKQQ